MSLVPPICTCDQRPHACSPPCKAHPELGGGLGNPGHPLDLDPYSPTADPTRVHLPSELLEALRLTTSAIRELEPGDSIVIKRHRPSRSPVDAEYTVTVRTHQ